MFTNTSFHLTCCPWLPRPLRHYWLTVVSCKTSHGREGAFAKSGQCEDPARMPPAHQTSVNLHYQISRCFPEPRNRHRTVFQFKKLSFNLSEYFLWIIDLDFTFWNIWGILIIKQQYYWYCSSTRQVAEDVLTNVAQACDGDGEGDDTLRRITSFSKPTNKWIQNQITKAKNGII